MDISSGDHSWALWGTALDCTSLRLYGGGDTGGAEVVEAGGEDDGEAGRVGCEDSRTLGAAWRHWNGNFHKFI